MMADVDGNIDVADDSETAVVKKSSKALSKDLFSADRAATVDESSTAGIFGRDAQRSYNLEKMAGR